jgi:hypothetical protein
MLEIAQQGIEDPTSKAAVSYQHHSDVTEPDEHLSRITPDHIVKLIEESGETSSLDNLKLSVAQENPIRSVQIEIDPEGWTYYTVQSSDLTWALGRFHELTEEFLKNRSRYTQIESPLPEILTQGGYRAWGAALWIPGRDGLLSSIRALMRVGMFLAFLLSIGVMISPGGVAPKSFAIATMAAIYGYIHWSRTLLKSHIIIDQTPRSVRAVLLSKQSDPTSRATHYIMILSIFVTIISIILKR